MRSLFSSQSGGDSPASSPNQPFQDEMAWLVEFDAFVEDHLSDPTLSIPGLAEEFGMSESTMLRLIKRLAGCTPVQYLQQKRLNEARRLLDHRISNSIQQVASQVGFSDPRHFSRAFRNEYGQLPSAYLK